MTQIFSIKSTSENWESAFIEIDNRPDSEKQQSLLSMIDPTT